ncbi:asparaginase, partial [bacterium]
DALLSGYKLLKEGKSAVDAVVECVRVMEDNPHFNAGYGSAMGLDGTIEMDAAVMSSDGKFGAVAGIKNVKNPVLVARKVMEETEHIILCGEGAERFAKLMGFSEFDPTTEWVKQKFKEKKSSYYKKLKELAELYGFGTVGAAALDVHGNLAAATSTGGLMFHLPGRVGDTPIPGGGTYASPLGAASASGHGECIAVNLVSFRAVDMLKEKPIHQVLGILKDEIPCRFGIILLDKHGNPGNILNADYMVWGYVKEEKLQVLER